MVYPLPIKNIFSLTAESGIHIFMIASVMFFELLGLVYLRIAIHDSIEKGKLFILNITFLKVIAFHLDLKMKKKKKIINLCVINMIIMRL